MLSPVSRWFVPAACALVQALSIVPGDVADSSAFVALLASAVGVLGGVALAWRGTAPLTALGVVVVAHMAQTALRGAVVPVTVAVALAWAGRTMLNRDGELRRRPTALVLGALGAVASAAAAVGRADLAPTYSALLLLTAAAGVLRAVSEFRMATQRRSAVEQERLRLARDLHDVVGHGMSAIAVQAGAGRVSLGVGDTDGAARALAGVEEASRAVLRETRWLVSLLRDDHARHRLVDVSDLVEGARRAGLTVVLETSATSEQCGRGRRGRVQGGAGGAHERRPACRRCPCLGRVEVGEEVDVQVVDEGKPVVQAADGNGLRGLRERVEALGGSVQAGPLRSAGGPSGRRCRCRRDGAGRHRRRPGAGP
jgi:signal transduction histidine kinase